MDTEILKKEVQRVIDALEAEGKIFDFVALIPTYPGDSQTSYIIQVHGDWITRSNFWESFSIVSDKLFEILDKSILLYINRIAPLDKHSDIQPWDEDLILINKINYKPDIWRLVQAQR